EKLEERVVPLATAGQFNALACSHLCDSRSSPTGDSCQLLILAWEASCITTAGEGECRVAVQIRPTCSNRVELTCREGQWETVKQATMLSTPNATIRHIRGVAMRV